jgi:hypothetical protein
LAVAVPTFISTVAVERCSLSAPLETTFLLYESYQRKWGGRTFRKSVEETAQCKEEHDAYWLKKEKDRRICLVSVDWIVIGMAGFRLLGG